MPSLRSSFLLLAVLAAGVALGMLLGTTPRAGRFPEPDDARFRGPRSEAAPVLKGRGEEGPPVLREERGPDVSPSVPAGQETPAVTGRHVPPVLEVRVTDAEGNPVGATVYAFPHDAVPQDWEEAPYGEHRPPGPCRLELPVPGLYDVFARSRYPVGVTRRTGVLVRAGDVVPIDLAVAAGRPIRIELGEPWPLADPLRAGRLKASIQILAARGVPGGDGAEGVLPRMGTFVPLRPLTGPWESRPLPPSLEFVVSVALTVPKAYREGALDGPGYRVFATPPIVRPGGTVRLHAERQASLHVRPRLEAPEAWPAGPIRLDLAFEDGRGAHTHTRRWRAPGSIRRQKRPLVFRGRPGKARLTWDGPGIAPGALEDLHLDATRALEAEIAIRLDASELPSREPLVVRLAGQGDPPSHGSGEDSLAAAAILESPGDDYPTVLEWRDDDRAEHAELDYGWRRADFLVVWRGAHEVSRPTPIPPRGSMTVTLEPAGVAIVVPCRLLREGVGRLRIRRADGLPFLLLRDRDQPVLRPGAQVQGGDLVGPLPAGRHTFQVELAGRRLPDATVVVEPGGVGILRLVW